MDVSDVLESSGLFLGLLYLYFEFRAHRLMWAVSLLMTCISFYVYWSHGLYADFGINIYYFLVAIYGFLYWSQGGVRAKGSTLPITHVPWQWMLCLIAFFSLIYGLIVWILFACTDSTVPYWDALNTSLSIVAMWMQARKWVEQWLIWLLVDAVSLGLYLYKEIYPYALLYAIYMLLAYVGYLHWMRHLGQESG